jgi:L,D-peptidoglycan transpeptidase YkuD (ErfK/YbiS/YcfS/YnhG family)
MNIKVTKNRLLTIANYKLKCSIGKSGIRKIKKEGDLVTPKGTFNIGYLYYRKDRIKKIKTNIKKKIIKKNMGWCNDSRSKKYNREIKYPFKYSAEKLYRKDSIYDLLINIKYNSRPVIKMRGSAIFLHLANSKYRPTAGCVAISKKNFLKILPHIKINTKIKII